MEIAKYFQSSSKKRDLSNNSEEGGNKKNKQDAAVDDSFKDEDDTLLEGLDSVACKDVLFKFLKSLEKRIIDIYDVTSLNKEMHGKNEKQLNDLTSSVQFISEKFDLYEKELQEKDKKIKELKDDVGLLQTEIGEMKHEMERQCQYTRRNCLLIHGVKEEENEDTDKIAVDIANKDLNITINKGHLDRSHRLGKRNNNTLKPRPIIVKFVRYNDRQNIFSNKKKLKGKEIAITESLTATRMKKLNDARNEHGFQNVWSVDGKIFFKSNKESRPKIYYD